MAACLNPACGHEWAYHTDAESQENESLGDREPCCSPGCECATFVYSNAKAGAS